jgi:hypothetical protein
MAQAPAFSFKTAKARALVAVFCAGCQAERFRVHPEINTPYRKWGTSFSQREKVAAQRPDEGLQCLRKFEIFRHDKVLEKTSKIATPRVTGSRTGT